MSRIPNHHIIQILTWKEVQSGPTFPAWRRPTRRVRHPETRGVKTFNWIICISTRNTLQGYNKHHIRLNSRTNCRVPHVLSPHSIHKAKHAHHTQYNSQISTLVTGQPPLTLIIHPSHSNYSWKTNSFSAILPPQLLKRRRSKLPPTVWSQFHTLFPVQASQNSTLSTHASTIFVLSEENCFAVKTCHGSSSKQQMQQQPLKSLSLGKQKTLPHCHWRDQSSR